MFFPQTKSTSPIAYGWNMKNMKNRMFIGLQKHQCKQTNTNSYTFVSCLIFKT